jgi:hypothetical protein
MLTPIAQTPDNASGIGNLEDGLPINPAGCEERRWDRQFSTTSHIQLANIKLNPKQQLFIGTHRQLPRLRQRPKQQPSCGQSNN